MRLRNISTGKLASAVETNPLYMEPQGPLDWQLLFGNANLTELEIGCGKGLFLLSVAEQFRGRNFFGIEIARKYAQFVADRAHERMLTNVRVARADAKVVLRDWVADESLTALHVYYPDPWWKRRHKKRRMFNAEFVATAVRVLCPNGQLRFATDVEEYFGVMRQLVGFEARFKPLPDAAWGPAIPGLEFTTNFEQKYRRVGKPVFRAVYQKTV